MSAMEEQSTWPNIRTVRLYRLFLIEHSAEYDIQMPKWTFHTTALAAAGLVTSTLPWPG